MRRLAIALFLAAPLVAAAASASGSGGPMTDRSGRSDEAVRSRPVLLLAVSASRPWLPSRPAVNLNGQGSPIRPRRTAQSHSRVGPGGRQPHSSLLAVAAVTVGSGSTGRRVRRTRRRRADGTPGLRSGRDRPPDAGAPAVRPSGSPALMPAARSARSPPAGRGQQSGWVRLR